MPILRAAAAQFEIQTNLAQNLETCLRIIDQAATLRPQVLVLPEFCNHLSWYRDQAHCEAVSVDLDGEWLAAISGRAALHGLYLMINCTVRRGGGVVTGTNILYGPDGERLAVSDKQVLMGNENNFLTKADAACPIIPTPYGLWGMYSCMDGVINETPRGLALRGAHVLLNSLNSFALDEGSLHVPVRAAENRVFVIGANKVGWLVPPELAPIIAERVKVAPEHLHGAGESQIVAPDGRVLAKAPHTGEAVIWAEFDPTEAAHKVRPDGTHIFGARRPALYQGLGEKPAPRQWRESARQISVAAYQPHAAGLAALDEVVSAVGAISPSESPALIVLPELCFFPDLGANPAPETEAQADQVVARLAEALRGRETLIAASIPARQAESWVHLGVLIGAGGVVHQQGQLHACGRHAWAAPADGGITVYDAAWGRVALIVGGDVIYPEAFRLAALAQAEVIAAPTRLLEAWEAALGLPERAAENRINVVVGSQAGQAEASAIYAITHDFTLWTAWEERPFDGNISRPQVSRAGSEAGWLRGTVYPSAAHNRLVSQKTDLVDGRPYWLLAALTDQATGSAATA